MNTDELDKLFEEAFQNAQLVPQSSVPQDVQLVLYGLYKQATASQRANNMNFLQEPQNIRSAFKLNAWMQVNSLSVEESKRRYIEIINKLMEERGIKK